jgi:hypothetical protein
MLGAPLRAQVPGAPTGAAATPVALAELVTARFASGSPEAFAAVYPFADGRAYVTDAARRGLPRVPGLARVAWADSARAVLVLSGYVAAGEAGSETIRTRAFANAYEATRGPGGWALARRLPLDAENRIRAHRLGVDLAPGRGVRVVDTLDVAVGAAHGFLARLHHRAVVGAARLDGRPVEHAFAGGLLWVQAPARPFSQIVLEYALGVPAETRSNGGSFTPESGVLRDQDFGHPVFNYRSASDQAAITVTVRAPAAYHVTTSVPQTAQVEGGTRVARGRADQPTPAVTLAYDRAWAPYAEQVGRLRFEAFVAPDFAPGRDTLVGAFRRTVALLGAQFGEPRAAYFAVAQRRAAPWSGWTYLSNNTVVAGRGGGPITSAGPFRQRPDRVRARRRRRGDGLPPPAGRRGVQRRRFGPPRPRRRACHPRGRAPARASGVRRAPGREPRSARRRRRRADPVRHPQHAAARGPRDAVRVPGPHDGRLGAVEREPHGVAADPRAPPAGGRLTRPDRGPQGRCSASAIRHTG